MSERTPLNFMAPLSSEAWVHLTVSRDMDADDLATLDAFLTTCRKVIAKSIAGQVSSPTERRPEE